MFYVSDNLRDFPERPCDIKNWDYEKLSKEFYITLSVVLKFQNNKEVLEVIKNFQEEIIEKISDSVGIFNNPYETRGLYKYSEKNFHFSLINFFKYVGAEELKGDASLQNNIKIIDKYLSENIYNNIPSEIKTDLRWIESGDKERPLHSFSLQVFPDFIFKAKLKKINDDLKNNIFKIKPKNSDFILKAYPQENQRRFSLNILRLINLDEKVIINEEIKVKIKNIVENINRKHNNKPLFTFNITKLSLVKSDPFLYNEDPEIKQYYS